MGVQVIGAKEVTDALSGAEAVIDRRATAYLNELGIWGIGRAKAYTLNAGAVDLGELVQGIHYETRRGKKAWITTIRPSNKADRYAIYVERGTKPHFPPISALQGWASRHGIPVWAVARKIAREGTEPRWIFRDTFEDLKEHVDATVGDFMIEITGDL